MDFQPEMQPETQPQHTLWQNKRSENLATASFILGLIALLTSPCIYLAMVCGALGIILALLSRGGELTLNTQGKTGLLLSSVGLILTISIYVGLFIILMNYYGGIDGIMQEYMNIYGVETMEELYQSMGIY